jgi:hypothetical protein
MKWYETVSTFMFFAQLWKGVTEQSIKWPCWELQIQKELSR